MHIITAPEWALLKHYGHIMAIHPPWVMSTDGKRGCFIKSPLLLGKPCEWLNTDTSDGPVTILPDTPLLSHGLDLPWSRVLDRFDSNQYREIPAHTPWTARICTAGVILTRPDLPQLRINVPVEQDGTFLIPCNTLTEALTCNT